MDTPICGLCMVTPTHLAIRCGNPDCSYYYYYWIDEKSGLTVPTVRTAVLVETMIFSSRVRSMHLINIIAVVYNQKEERERKRQTDRQKKRYRETEKERKKEKEHIVRLVL